MAKSSIEWTESTWNPLTGCTKISPGCENCYAERMASRLQAMGQPTYRNGFELTLQPQQLDVPLRWRKPQMIFVNSMSDLFHKDMPEAFIQRVFDTMRRAHWHHFQVLTKRADRLAALSPRIDWPHNVWMGASVESEKYVGRVELPRSTRARTNSNNGEDSRRVEMAESSTDAHGMSCRRAGNEPLDSSSRTRVQHRPGDRPRCPQRETDDDAQSKALETRRERQ